MANHGLKCGSSHWDRVDISMQSGDIVPGVIVSGGTEFFYHHSYTHTQSMSRGYIKVKTGGAI